MNTLKGKIFTFTLASLLIGFCAIYTTSISQLMNLSERWSEQQMRSQLLLLALSWEQAGGCNNPSNKLDFDQLAPQLYSKTKFGLLIYCNDQLVSKTREALEPTVFTSDLEVIDRQAEFYTFAISHPVNNGWAVVTLSEYYLEVVEDTVVFDMLLITLFQLGLVLLVGYLYLNTQFRSVFKLSKLVQGSGQIKPIEMDKLDVVDELRPLVVKLNELNEQVASSKIALENKLTHEKSFTANAAHELLTPMAAIKAEVQLQLSLAESDELKAVFSDINDRVDRASYTIDQLMTLARLDPEVAPSAYTNFDLVPLVHQALGLNSQLAHDKEIDIEFQCPEELAFFGVEDAMSVLINNMFTNAFKYCLPASVVKVGAVQTANGIELFTENDCERIPSYLLEHMTDRFIRGAEVSEQGTGLGMSIIERGAQLNNGKLSLVPSNNHERLRVSVLLALPKTDTE